MADQFEKLRTLARKLPKGLSADWQYTNHYEFHTNDTEFFWVILRDLPSLNFDTPFGQEVGNIMDIVAEVGRLKDEGIL